jgi:hypothetical protein
LLRNLIILTKRALESATAYEDSSGASGSRNGWFFSPMDGCGGDAERRGFSAKAFFSGRTVNATSARAEAAVFV